MSPSTQARESTLTQAPIPQIAPPPSRSSTSPLQSSSMPLHLSRAWGWMAGSSSCNRRRPRSRSGRARRRPRPRRRCGRNHGPCRRPSCSPSRHRRASCRVRVCSGPRSRCSRPRCKPDLVGAEAALPLADALITNVAHRAEEPVLTEGTRRAWEPPYTPRWRVASTDHALAVETAAIHRDTAATDAGYRFGGRWHAAPSSQAVPLAAWVACRNAAPRRSSRRYSHRPHTFAPGAAGASATVARLAHGAEQSVVAASPSPAGATTHASTVSSQMPALQGRSKCPQSRGRPSQPPAKHSSATVQ